jgi:hypothetical protein
MKTIKILSMLALSLFVVTSCDNGFDELNKSKTGAISVDEIFILNNAIISASAPSGTLQYDLGIIQQIISSNSGVISGANFNTVNNDNAAANWQNYYRNVIKYTSDVQAKTKDVPSRGNLYNMARIIQSYAFMILTDTYGDIPYTDAGQGYNASNFFPKYDKQQDIYPAIIAELTAATNALTTSSSVQLESGDVLYAGNVAQWKKFGFSLLLRAGMRLSKVNPALAQSTVAAAATGGVILVTADNATIKHDANYVNGVGNTLNSTEAANYYLTKPFVDALKTNNDPRLAAIAVRYTTATSGTGQTSAGPDSTPANQYGMPMGSDDAGAQAAALANVPPLASRYAFSQVDRNRMASKLAPMFLVTAAQTNLLLAEARNNNWISSGTALAYFNAGITEAMRQLALYGSGSAVATSDINTYVASRATGFAANPVKEINYEYWVASFLNGQEAWANLRRSGYPVLAPNPYPSRTVDFITRLIYPVTENLVNTANYSAAVANMGGDKLDGKVWWHK